MSLEKVCKSGPHLKPESVNSSKDPTKIQSHLARLKGSRRGCSRSAEPAAVCCSGHSDSSHCTDKSRAINH